MQPKFMFSDIVVVEGSLIGTVVKTWGASANREIHYEVYVKSLCEIREYDEEDLVRFTVSKELSQKEREEEKPRFTPMFMFGDIVVAEGSLIGVVVDIWGNTRGYRDFSYKVYVRDFNSARSYDEYRLARYVISEELSEEQKQFH